MNGVNTNMYRCSVIYLLTISKDHTLPCKPVVFPQNDSSNGLSIQHESEGWGLEFLTGRDIFCHNNFDTFTRTSVRLSKMNALAHAQLTFQMLSLLHQYLYHHSQYSKAWNSKCLALINQVVRTFGMNLKVGGWSPPQVETFSVSKTLTLSQEHPFVCQKWMLLPMHS